MVVKLISLPFVRMAVRRSHYEHQIVAAVSHKYRHTLYYDGTPLHGACVIVSTLGQFP